MASFRHIRLSIPQRLWLLTIIPIFGMVAAGTMCVRSLYSEYQGFDQDAKGLAAFHGEVDQFLALVSQLDAERDQAVQAMSQPSGALARRAYQAGFAATDKAVADMNTRLDRLAASPQAAAFAEKDPVIRAFFVSQLPLARAEAVDGKHAIGDVYYIYLKLDYEALFVSECYRATIHTPVGLNFFDAILSLQKIQLQIQAAMKLALLGSQQGGLTKDALSVLRRQWIDSSENEYYMLKFQPDLRAFYKDLSRKSDDEIAWFQYLTDVAGTQRDNTPLPVFTPKAQSLAALVAKEFQVFDSVYAYAFSRADEQLREVAGQRQQRASLITAALAAGILLSLGANLAITRSTRRSLAMVSKTIAVASNDVKAASTQLSGAGDQIAQDSNLYVLALEKIDQSLTHLSSVASTNKTHAVSAASTSTRARDSVDAGLATIHELDQAMNSARNSAQKINQIIARINELSFQTNLLALNAAVEAARAGAAGTGFAVVADEVRGLASRCAEAAKETADLIGHSAQDTEVAIAKSDELATRFKSVSTNIHEVNETVNMISTNFQQQAASIVEINESVRKQRKIAQSLAASARQTAGTAQSMEGQVESLEASVLRMDVMLGGRPTQPALPLVQPRLQTLAPATVVGRREQRAAPPSDGFSEKASLFLTKS